MADFRPIEITAFDIASRFIGVKEVAGTLSNPLILAMLRLDDAWPQADEVPWCSAYANFVCWLLRLPRSKSLAARSWLAVGEGIPLEDARVGFDVVVLTRGDSPLSGHVGFFAGWQTENPALAHQQVLILGGNQGDTVGVAPFPRSRVVSVRRLLSA